MTQPADPLSVRAHAAACLMYQSDHRGSPPKSEDFAHLDAVAHPGAPEPAATSQQPTPTASSGWDFAAFAALPDDTRAAVIAGVAQQTGRTVLENEAQLEMLRPSDVHLHLTDAAKYVDARGNVDRDAIRHDLRQLTHQRPELSRYGHGKGQEGTRPDTWRHGPQDGRIGAAGSPASTLTGRVAGVSAVMNSG